MPPDPAPHRARAPRLFRVAFWALLASAACMLALPLPLPTPLRLAVAATDLIAAAVVWLAGRQRARL